MKRSGKRRIQQLADLVADPVRVRRATAEVHAAAVAADAAGATDDR